MTKKKFDLPLALKANKIVQNYLDMAMEDGLKEYFVDVGNIHGEDCGLVQDYLEKIVDYAKKKIDAMPLKELV